MVFINNAVHSWPQPCRNHIRWKPAVSGWYIRENQVSVDLQRIKNHFCIKYCPANYALITWIYELILDLKWVNQECKRACNSTPPSQRWVLCRVGSSFYSAWLSATAPSRQYPGWPWVVFPDAFGFQGWPWERNDKTRRLRSIYVGHDGFRFWWSFRDHAYAAHCH